MTDRSRPWGNAEQPDMLAVAATLHSAWTGGSDPLPPEERDRLLVIVHDRLMFWTDSACAYDEAVRAMLRAVVAEYQEEVR